MIQLIVTSQSGDTCNGICKKSCLDIWTHQLNQIYTIVHHAILRFCGVFLSASIILVLLIGCPSLATYDISVSCKVGRTIGVVPS